MTTVRELLISFGTEIDRNSLKKTENQVKGASQGMQKILSTALQTGFVVGLARGVLELTKMASVVEETMNVINVSFGENTKIVMDWADSFAAATGRSRYELQKTASDLGALLTPMMEGNTLASAEMSTNLAQLSVDLASFFNRADSDVLVALRSGIVGEIEPMRRLGVNMTIARLEAYALAQGISTSYKEMEEAERTTLRYNFLMEKTAMVQGDAERTAKSFENSSKAVQAAFKDMGTEIGLKLLPLMSKLNQGILWVTGAFSKLTAGTKIIEALLITLGATAVAVGLKLLIAFAPILLPLALIAAKIALVAIALEDFYTFLQGGDSVIGRFIDSVWGPGSATEAAEKLREAWQALKVFWATELLPGIKSLTSAFVQFVNDTEPIWRSFFEDVASMIRMVVEGWKLLFGLLIDEGIPAVKSFSEIISENWGKLFNWIAEKIDWLLPKMTAFFDELKKGAVAAADFLGFELKLPDFSGIMEAPDFSGVLDKLGGISKKPEKYRIGPFREEYEGGYSEDGRQIRTKTNREELAMDAFGLPGKQTNVSIADTFGVPRGSINPSVPASQVSNADNRSTTQNNITQNVTESTTVNVGEATPQTARTIAERANEGNREVNRKTLAALQQKARAS